MSYKDKMVQASRGLYLTTRLTQLLYQDQHHQHVFRSLMMKHAGFVLTYFLPVIYLTAAYVRDSANRYFVWKINMMMTMMMNNQILFYLWVLWACTS